MTIPKRGVLRSRPRGELRPVAVMTNTFQNQNNSTSDQNGCDDSVKFEPGMRAAAKTGMPAAGRAGSSVGFARQPQSPCAACTARAALDGQDSSACGAWGVSVDSECAERTAATPCSLAFAAARSKRKRSPTITSSGFTIANAGSSKTWSLASMSERRRRHREPGVENNCVLRALGNALGADHSARLAYCHDVTLGSHRDIDRVAHNVLRSSARSKRKLVVRRIQDILRADNDVGSGP